LKAIAVLFVGRTRKIVRRNGLSAKVLSEGGLTQSLAINSQTKKIGAETVKTIHLSTAAIDFDVVTCPKIVEAQTEAKEQGYVLIFGDLVKAVLATKNTRSLSLTDNWDALGIRVIDAMSGYDSREKHSEVYLGHLLMAAHRRRHFESVAKLRNNEKSQELGRKSYRNTAELTAQYVFETEQELKSLADMKVSGKELAEVLNVRGILTSSGRDWDEKKISYFRTKYAHLRPGAASQ